MGELIAADVIHIDAFCFNSDSFDSYDRCDSLDRYPSFPPLLEQESPNSLVQKIVVSKYLSFNNLILLELEKLAPGQMFSHGISLKRSFFPLKNMKTYFLAYYKLWS